MPTVIPQLHKELRQVVCACAISTEWLNKPGLALPTTAAHVTHMLTFVY